MKSVLWWGIWPFLLAVVLFRESGGFEITFFNKYMAILATVLAMRLIFFQQKKEIRRLQYILSATCILFHVLMSLALFSTNEDYKKIFYDYKEGIFSGILAFGCMAIFAGHKFTNQSQSHVKFFLEDQGNRRTYYAGPHCPFRVQNVDGAIDPIYPRFIFIVFVYSVLPNAGYSS